MVWKGSEEIMLRAAVTVLWLLLLTILILLIVARILVSEIVPGWLKLLILS